MVDVVIVNWNGGVHLSRCVESLVRFGVGWIGRIIVVDNDSSDGSDRRVEGLPGVKVVEAGGNLGFAKACNLGANYAESDFLLFLNPDAEIYERTLPVALEYMDDLRNAKVGVCGVQLRDETGCVAKSCSRFPSPWRFAAHAMGCDRLFPALGHVMAEWQHDHTQVVDQVIGAFFLVRRAVFEQLKGFDERFFVYYEEVDFSYRAKKAGWQSVYLADAQAFHLGGGTSDQVKARRLFYSLRSRLLYAFKHFRLAGALVVLLATVVIEPVSRTIFAIVRRAWPVLGETWSGVGMLWRWLPQWAFKGVTR